MSLAMLTLSLEKDDLSYAHQVGEAINEGRANAREHVESDLAGVSDETRKKILLGINKVDRFNNAIEYYEIKEHKESSKLQQFANFLVKNISDTSVNYCAHRAVVTAS